MSFEEEVGENGCGHDSCLGCNPPELKDLLMASGFQIGMGPLGSIQDPDGDPVICLTLELRAIDPLSGVEVPFRFALPPAMGNEMGNSLQHATWTLVSHPLLYYVPESKPDANTSAGEAAVSLNFPRDENAPLVSYEGHPVDEDGE